MKSTYVVVAHMPACSAVLFVNPNLPDPYKVTILREDTAVFCEAFALGVLWGSAIDNKTLMGGAIHLPAGNPALSFSTLILGGAK